MYFELIENSISNRGTVVQATSINLEPFHSERYISMFGFDASILEHLEITKLETTTDGKLKYPNGTVSGFHGHYFCNSLIFDIDNEESPSESLITARAFIQLLYKKYQLNPKQVTIAFSGNKGFHIGLNKNLFRGIEPSQTLPKDIQILAGSIVADVYDTTLQAIDTELKGQSKKNYKNIDLGIYNPNRIFRALNSKHLKSGLYKIGLSSTELFTLTIEQIKQLAATARPDFKPEVPNKELTANEYLQALLLNAKKFDPEAHIREMKKDSSGRTSIGNFFSPPAQGNRNQGLFAQACMLFDHSDFQEESIRQLISCINLASPAPLADDEIRQIVRSASNRTAKNEKVNLKPVENMETFGSWLTEWVEYYSAEPDKLSCIFPDMDADNEFNFKGKLTCLIGKGGSLKSFFAQNILAYNIQNHNARILTSSMEMGKIELVNRLLNMLFDPIDGMSASRYLKGKVKAEKNKEGWIQTMKDTVSHIDNNLILSNQSFMTPDNYREMIEKTERLYGELDILVVDGLSAMGGTGSETEIYSRNSLALKEIAKEFNIWVILICHVTKQAMPYDRDPINHIRGSEKILDNADFFLSFSKLINEHTSTPENLDYIRSYGHIKYYNKRGSGLTLNKLFFFEDQTNKMVPADVPIINFPTFEQFSKDYKKRNNKETAPWQ